MEGADPVARALLMEGLAELKDEAAAAELVKRMSDMVDRAAAARALKMMGPVAERSVLLLLTDKDVLVRAEACWVLAEIGGPDSLAALEKASKDDNRYYSSVAAQALAAVTTRLKGGEKK
jgi:HEAT repeat protein